MRSSFPMFAAVSKCDKGIPMNSSRASSLSGVGTTMPPTRTILKTMRRFGISKQRSMKNLGRAIIPMLCIFCLPDEPWELDEGEKEMPTRTVKERLAQDYAKDLLHTDKPGETIFVRTAYQAGFDQARKRCAEIWKKGERHAYADLMWIGEEPDTQ